MTDRTTSALDAMNEAVMAIAAERSVESVLQRIVHVARELAGARYAALGIPDGEGNFAQFITSGMTEEEVAAMGPLPRTHGLLGAMLTSEEPYRTGDIKQDPRFRGWWPRAHPLMSSFLGVPIVSRTGIVAAFYLTDKEAADEFTPDDQRLIEMLAGHAAIAIENARLYERSRELSAVEERNRLARDLHDSVVQKLFGVVLTAQSAATLLERDPGEARVQVDKLQELAQDAIQELRSLVFQLRPAAVETDGLAAALRKHVEVLRRVHRQQIELEATGETRLRPKLDDEVFRIAQEALHNAIRHADAGHIRVRLHERPETLSLSVEDDGRGFDPGARALRSRRLGLTSMEERARALGGRLEIRSTRGEGTTIGLEVPLGEDSRADRR
ncbi:MAG TPA: GAF domain-containing sensor histidine kinase [Thermoleophilaceae bacterium]|jgi:signal transduction histidine kinase